MGSPSSRRTGTPRISVGACLSEYSVHQRFRDFSYSCSGALYERPPAKICSLLFASEKGASSRLLLLLLALFPPNFPEDILWKRSHAHWP